MAASEKQEYFPTVSFEWATSETNSYEKAEQESFCRKAAVYILLHTWPT